QGTERMKPCGIEPLQFGERRNFSFEAVQRLPLLFPPMDEDGHAVAQRYLAEPFGWLVKERPAGEGQRPHKPIAERIMHHRRAPARRMVADLLLRLEHRHARMVRQRGRSGESRNAPTDDEDIGVRHAGVSRSFTILPLWVRRIALTISSSSGSAGPPCSLSQKALRKLYRLRANSAEESAARLRARFEAPMIVTPCFSTCSPLTVPSTLPPASAARSTITLPGRIVATCESLISRGAGLPGISAVVMTMSCLAIWPDTSSACAFWYSGDISVA